MMERSKADSTGQAMDSQGEEGTSTDGDSDGQIDDSELCEREIGVSESGREEAHPTPNSSTLQCHHIGVPGSGEHQHV